MVPVVNTVPAMPSSRSAVALSLVPVHVAMSPAPTSTAAFVSADDG